MGFKLNGKQLKGNEQYLYEMGFSLDPTNKGGGNSDFQPIAKGEYEVFPSAFEVSYAQSGNEMVTFNYIIRDDVEQEFKGREIRYDRFVITPNAMWRVNQASDSAGLDMSKEYAGAKDWAEDFKNKAVRVYVDHRVHDGKTYAEIKSFKPSQVGGTRESGNDTIDIEDEQIPF